MIIIDFGMEKYKQIQTRKFHIYLIKITIFHFTIEFNGRPMLRDNKRLLFGI